MNTEEGETLVIIPGPSWLNVHCPSSSTDHFTACSPTGEHAGGSWFDVTLSVLRQGEDLRLCEEENCWLAGLTRPCLFITRLADTPVSYCTELNTAVPLLVRVSAAAVMWPAHTTVLVMRPLTPHRTPLYRGSLYSCPLLAPSLPGCEGIFPLCVCTTFSSYLRESSHFSCPTAAPNS